MAPRSIALPRPSSPSARTLSHNGKRAGHTHLSFTIRYRLADCGGNEYELLDSLRNADSLLGFLVFSFFLYFANFSMQTAVARSRRSFLFGVAVAVFTHFENRHAIGAAQIQCTYIRVSVILRIRYYNSDVVYYNFD